MSISTAFFDVAVYNTRVMGCAHIRNVTDLACRTALNFRGVAHLNIPSDIQDEESDERSSGMFRITQGISGSKRAIAG